MPDFVQSLRWMSLWRWKKKDHLRGLYMMVINLVLAQPKRTSSKPCHTRRSQVHDRKMCGYFCYQVFLKIFCRWALTCLGSDWWESLPMARFVIFFISQYERVHKPSFITSCANSLFWWKGAFTYESSSPSLGRFSLSIQLVYSSSTKNQRNELFLLSKDPVLPSQKLTYLIQG